MSDIYESEHSLSQYLLFHYGSDEDNLPYPDGPREALHYPARCVSECLDPDTLPDRARALDLGCAVGRSTFELARHCSEAIGIDYSHRFISAARQLAERGSIEHRRFDEGHLSAPVTYPAPGDVDRSRVSFEQGDAMNLREDLGSFDVVLMANLIDRLPDPRACLDRLPDLVNPGGQLIVTSPYTWLEEFTPKENWLGGFEREGKAVHTSETLGAILNNSFTLRIRKNMPFFIRDHVRKFQWSVAEATVWLKR